MCVRSKFVNSDIVKEKEEEEEKKTHRNTETKKKRNQCKSVEKMPLKITFCIDVNDSGIKLRRPLLCYCDFVRQKKWRIHVKVDDNMKIASF